MKVFVLQQVLDNPLFEGLAVDEAVTRLNSYPDDWQYNYLTWEAKRFQDTWKPPIATGNVRAFNDYPCVNLTWPAFSRRAVESLADLLLKNGELLPIRHRAGDYFYFNCTTIVNGADLNRSDVTRFGKAIVTTRRNLVFIEKIVAELSIFRIRTDVVLFCTQQFVDRVIRAGLQGFMFIPIWPLPEGVTYYQMQNAMIKDRGKIRPREMNDLEIKGNTLVVRLGCKRKLPSKSELAAADQVVEQLNSALYDPNQSSSQAYFGNIEGSQSADYEIRVFISTPDVERLVAHVMPILKVINWPGSIQAVKRRGEYVDDSALEEYIPIY